MDESGRSGLDDLWLKPVGAAALSHTIQSPGLRIDKGSPGTLQELQDPNLPIFPSPTSHSGDWTEESGR